jgi:hypothetical protein
MPAENLHAGMGINTTDFARFAKALAIAGPLLSRTLKINMRGVGDLVAQEARTIVGPYSTTIPDSIKVRVGGFGATVSVVAGGPGVPMAGLLELGTSGSAKNATTFRHPVFGNRDVWATQSMHPFLGPAVARKIDAAETAAVEALDLAVEEAVHGG